jgi:hypothetical protein
MRANSPSRLADDDEPENELRLRVPSLFAVPRDARCQSGSPGEAPLREVPDLGDCYERTNRMASVKLDANDVARASWNSAIPVDRGDHRMV